MSNMNPSQRIPDNELGPVVEKLFEELGVVNLAVSDVLYEKGATGRELRALAVLFYEQQKKEREAAEKAEQARQDVEQRAELARQQMELGQKKAEEGRQVAAKLRERLGIRVIPLEELNEKLEVAATNSSPLQQIPQAVIDLSEKLGGKLPSFVFEDSEYAKAFRWWLSRDCSAPLHNTMRMKDLSLDYLEALAKRKDQLPPFFEAIGQVIMAWGFDPKHDKTDSSYLENVRSLLDGSKFSWLTQPPKVETAEEKAARGQAEAEQKYFNELTGKLKARLLETNPELADVTAEQMAKRLAKKRDQLSDISQIFATAAINRMVSANGEELAECTAKVYAKAAGLTDEDFEAAVSALRQQRADEAQAQAEKASLKKAREGVMRPETAAAHAAKKNGQKNKKDKKKQY